MRAHLRSPALALSAVGLLAGTVQAAEFPIGEPVQRDGMEIGAVYLQSVVMEPMLPGMGAQADVHLEADVRALPKNPNGFGPGEWVPYLGITYRLQKLGSDWEQVGPFMPMVASDGPHYGANVKLDGPGKYRLTYRFQPPPYQGFFRHTDKETGVAAWWAPFDVSWELSYVGVGKKGGY